MNDAGFTLVEALVGLAIVAVAAAGILRATEAHVDRIDGLERRAAAQLVAENRLAELALGGARPGEVEMLGRRFNVTEARLPSSDPALTRIDVSVAEAGAPHPLVTLPGFVDAGLAR